MRAAISLILSICLVSSALPIAAQERVAAMRVSIDRAIAREYGDPRHGELRQAVIQSYEHNVLLMLVLRDGTRLTGRIGQQDDATFRLMDLQGRSHTVSYAQVANLSTTTVVKVAAAVAIAVLVGVLWKNCLYRC